MNKLLIIPALALALILGTQGVMAEEGADDATSDSAEPSKVQRMNREFPPDVVPERSEVRQERREDFLGEDGERHPFFERRAALLVLEGCGKRLGELRDSVRNFATLTDNEKEVKREVLEARRERIEEYRATLGNDTSSSTGEGDVARLRQYASECRASIVQNAGDFAVDRLEAVVSMMERFIDKLQARLEKIKGDGTDISNYEAQLNNIQSRLDTVKLMTSDISSALSESEPDMVSVKVMIHDAHEFLKETREMLRAFLEEIKGAKSE